MAFYLGTTPIAEYESGQDFNQIENEGGEVIPTTENIVLPANSYFKNNLTIKGDPDLVEANIKKGISLFGKTGSAGPFPNGTEWEQSNITTSAFTSVYNANGIWVATTSSIYGLYYSTDGKSWTQGNLNASLLNTSGFNIVYNANGIWVAGAESDGLWYSTDGKNWTQSNLTGGYIYSISYANGFWYAGGRDAFVSTDGKTWEILGLNVEVSSVCNGVDVNSGNEYWVISTMGIGLGTWIDGGWETSTIEVGNFGTIYYANGIWVVSSLDSKGLYYSIDVYEWTQSNITSGNFYDFYNANGIWVACGDSGLYYSTDGKTWIQSNITSGTFKSVYNASGIWIACGEGIYYSINGKTWTQSNIINESFNSVYNANGMWVAGNGANNGLYYSVSWEPNPPLIGFWIEDTLYQTEEGMIWEQWVNSPYNDKNYSILDSAVMTASGAPVLKDKTTPVNKNENIEVNASYITGSASGGGAI